MVKKLKLSKKITIWISLIVLFQNFNVLAQNDTVKTPIYESIVSKKLLLPTQVSYKLYKGGGNCDRSGFSFKNDSKIPLKEKEYMNSGYDKGHLANAEDFAYDCKLDEYTFRYYNCLPQSANLNRGVWKKWETSIRKESQQDSLYVVAGGIWDSEMQVNGMKIPSKCWKVVYSLTTGMPIHILIFSNKEKNSTCKITSMDVLSSFGIRLRRKIKN
jgi:DNA/RNA endonuclease G (NUC1)